ncbi:calmodulin [Sorghum bicolor]|nr:calmodulin [Sorghum bicolor]|eukprot:XP_002467969.2 calmodulin [Sorghum bicolor]
MTGESVPRSYKYQPLVRCEQHKPQLAATFRKKSRAHVPFRFRGPDSLRVPPLPSPLPPPPVVSRVPAKQASMCPTGKYLGLDLSAAAVSGAGGDLRPAFDVLDADRDGRISREDLKSFYAAAEGPAAGERFDDDDLAAMIAAADADRDGFVQYDEFERLLASRAAAAAGGAGRRAAMEDAFRLMDRDGDGKVGFEDLKAYLGWAGMPAADEEVRAMIRVAGGGDGGDEGVGLEALARVLAVDLEGIAV